MYILEANNLNIKLASSSEDDLRKFVSKINRLRSEKIVDYNTFLWRQQDSTRNSVQMVAQSLCSHKELQGKNINEQQELIFQKGQNWNDYPTFCKRGTFFYRGDSGYVIDLDCPILSQDKNWFFKKLPMIEQPEKIL